MLGFSFIRRRTAVIEIPDVCGCTFRLVDELSLYRRAALCNHIKLSIQIRPHLKRHRVSCCTAVIVHHRQGSRVGDQLGCRVEEGLRVDGIGHQSIFTVAVVPAAAGVSGTGILECDVNGVAPFDIRNGQFGHWNSPNMDRLDRSVRTTRGARGNQFHVKCRILGSVGGECMHRIFLRGMFSITKGPGIRSRGVDRSVIELHQHRTACGFRGLERCRHRGMGDVFNSRGCGATKPGGSVQYDGRDEVRICMVFSG